VRTEDLFRQTNERIRQAVEEHAVDIRVPFIRFLNKGATRAQTEA
jgi:hypothetical protein